MKPAAGVGKPGKTEEEMRRKCFHAVVRIRTREGKLCHTLLPPRISLVRRSYEERARVILLGHTNCHAKENSRVPISIALTVKVKGEHR